VGPASINYPGEFDDLDEARVTAFVAAKDLVGTMHSIVIESMDGGTINEHWVRDGDRWRREDA
jgi:hypothetical protein